MKTRILHLEASPGWGGQEMRILREAEGMRLRGHEVILAVMRGGMLAQRARDKGFTIYELNFHRHAWISCLVSLVKIMKKHRIEIVNTHSSLDSWIGGIAGRCAGRKIIRTRHFASAGNPGWNSRLLYGYLADFVVTVCKAPIETISQQSGKPLDFFLSLPTGIDPLQIEEKLKGASDFRQGLGIESGSFLVGTVCFMRSWKGIGDFIQAAHLLRDRRDLQWVVVGGGHEEEYRKLAKDLHLEGIVYFAGHLENPFPALQALDAFALLSTANEAVAQAAQQAAYLKKPLITTTIGGLPEICIDGVTGILVPPFDPASVAAAVDKLKGDRALCERFGSKGREVVLECFTFQQTLDGMEKAYTILLQK